MSMVPPLAPVSRRVLLWQRRYVPALGRYRYNPTPILTERTVARWSGPLEMLVRWVLWRLR